MRKTIVLFDLDGTLALIDHRRPLLNGTNDGWRAFYAACSKDTVNTPVAMAFDAHRQAGHQVWIVSGRSDEVRTETWEWLTRNGLKPDTMLMRHAADHQPDHDLKRSWLDCGSIPKERVLCVYDDRDSVVAMWRSEGIPCFQVAPGAF